jgi:hypothetical protein
LTWCSAQTWPRCCGRRRAHWPAGVAALQRSDPDPGPHDPYLGDGLRQLRNILKGRYPLVPSGGLPIVDVRDVAAVHAAVLEPGRGPPPLPGRRHLPAPPAHHPAPSASTTQVGASRPGAARRGQPGAASGPLVMLLGGTPDAAGLAPPPWCRRLDLFAPWEGRPPLDQGVQQRHCLHLAITQIGILHQSP